MNNIDLRSTGGLLIAFLLLCSTSFSQSSGFSPFIGLGVGSFTFYGDVGNNHSEFAPTVGNLGFQLKLSNQLNENFDLSFEALFGQLAANERGLLRNANFKSEIRNGGIHLGYNFGHFLPDGRTITPVLNIGVTGFEFLSKTDLFDEFGNRYNYWDDGTIRDLPQDSENAASAVIIDRDYTYESDLRDLDLDGIGDYNERSFSIPVGITAQFRISEFVKCDLGTRLYFTGTDLIDNITGESIGNRVGNNANDKFLFTSFTLSYGLHKKIEKSGIDGIDKEMLASLTDRADEDDDGIIDLLDNCPHTPEGVEVDRNGCPVDGDEDGVPDYLDDELESAEGAVVNSRGVTMTDDFYEQKYLDFTNGQAINTIEGTVQSADIPKPVFTPRPNGKKFMVQVGETQQGISSELVETLLSMPDVQTVERGDTVLYMVGDYSTLPDAVRRKLALDESGITGSVVSSEDGVISDLSAEATELEDRLTAGKAMGDNEGELWRVQVGAFRYKLSKNIFASLENMVVINGDDGLTRYFSGVYDNRADADEYKTILRKSGFNDAFLAAFENGKRKNIDSETEGTDDVSSYDDLWARPSPDAFDESKIIYSIKLAESDGSIDPRKLVQFLELGNVDQRKDRGRTFYLIGAYRNVEDARNAVQEYRQAGLTESEVIGDFNGKILSEDEIQEMRNN